MDFEPDFWNPQMHSFPNMYNTMVKNGRFGREKAFYLKNCRKNSVLGGNFFGSPDFGEV